MGRQRPARRAGGDDALTAGDHDANLVGGNGDDGVLIWYDSESLNEVRVDGGGGVDWLSFFDSVPVSVNLASGVFSVQNRYSDANQLEGTVASIENVQGNDAADVLIGDDGPNVLWGGFGKDKLYGRGGDDQLVGDRLTDLFADHLWGEAGNDTLNAGAVDPLHTDDHPGDICAGEALSYCNDVRTDTNTTAL